MTTALLQQLLRSFGVLSALLLLGMFLRAKVPFFKKTLLPASVIGGLIGLILGPNVLGTHALPIITSDYVSIWSLIPGIFIIPIFAAVPLGQGMGKKKAEKGAFKKRLPKLLVSCGLFAGTGELQMVIGFGFTCLFATLVPAWGLYRTFGYELWAGFCGGHGTAGTVGAILQNYNIDYWETAQGVATTFATIGILGGMLLGIARINIAGRRGETKNLNFAGIPEDVASGITKDISQQGSVGREMTHNSSIESLTVQLAIILADVALAFWFYNMFQTYNVTGLKSIPVWCYALLFMYPINALLKLFKLDWMVDARLKAKISGMLSDYAICAAVASVPIKAVLGFIVPILILSVIGFIVTYLCCFGLSRLFYGKKDYPFERAIICWGTNTGVMITGMMLLKICDPNYDSPALEDFTGGYALMSLISLPLAPIGYSLIATGTTLQNLLFVSAVTLLYAVIAIVGHILLKKQDPSGFTKGADEAPAQAE